MNKIQRIVIERVVKNVCSDDGTTAYFHDQAQAMSSTVGKDVTVTVTSQPAPEPVRLLVTIQGDGTPPESIARHAFSALTTNHVWFDRTVTVEPAP